MNDLQLRTNGLITYTEFIAATIDRDFYFDEKKLTMIFRIFDVDHTGKITFDNINECFKRRGIHKSKKTIEIYLKEYDFEHNTFISLQLLC